MCADQRAVSGRVERDADKIGSDQKRAAPMAGIAAHECLCPAAGHLSNRDGVEFARGQKLGLKRCGKVGRRGGRSIRLADRDSRKGGFNHRSLRSAGQDIAAGDCGEAASGRAAQGVGIDAIPVGAGDTYGPARESGRSENRCLCPRRGAEQRHAARWVDLVTSDQDRRAQKCGAEFMQPARHRSQYWCDSPSPPGCVTAPL